MFHSKAVLRKFSGAAIQAQDCTFATAAGQLTLGEAVLATNPLKVNEQICNDDLRATWEGMQMSGQNSRRTRRLYHLRGAVRGRQGC